MKIFGLFVALTLIWSALSPPARAVVPAPDGGYPNGNTAEGNNALNGLITGENNTANGAAALFNNATGNLNTAIGAHTLYNNNANENTATGASALFNNITGRDNTANGSQALWNNTTGSLNTANGEDALFDNTTGRNNTANGFAALFSNTTGSNNTANGEGALLNNTIGGFNTATGANALDNNTIGGKNTATGFNAISANTTGNFNAAFGSAALGQSTTGSGNTAVGYAALYYFISGRQNTALGYFAGSNVTTANDVICIGSTGANVDSSTWIGNIYSVSPQSGTTAPVVVSNTGQLGTVASSERFKKDIAPMDKTSEAILSLRPVKFHYKTDTNGTAQFGLIAEEVAKVNPALVLPDKEGKPYTVRYDAVNAMLLNEFLKEHRKNEEQGATITSLRANDAKQEATIAELKKDLQANAAHHQKQIDALSAALQKVSAQLELSKAAPQTVCLPAVALRESGNNQ